MKHAQIAVMDESGTNLWYGSLYQFAHDNAMSKAEVTSLVAELRVEQAPAFVGGGAAPAFMVSLLG